VFEEVKNSLECSSDFGESRNEGWAGCVDASIINVKGEVRVLKLEAFVKEW
jgi:hypothetical protein